LGAKISWHVTIQYQYVVPTPKADYYMLCVTAARTSAKAWRDANVVAKRAAATQYVVVEIIESTICCAG